MTIPPDGATEVEVPDARELLAQGALLIDVREYDEWRAGHAPEARHIPMGQLGSAIGDFDPAHRLVIICRSGNRSAYATAALRQAGFDALNLVGGMQAWQATGGAVVTDDGATGWVI